MNYEKKYKEALERARELLGDMNKKEYFASKADIENIFPELKESEDEQSKKWILEYLHDGLRKSDEQFKGQYKTAIAWLEKQGENKSVDKPKFKVGDWILNDVCFPLQIASIRDGMYVFTEGDAISVSFVDGNYHLWTIEDAMDGDVLVDEDNNIGIYVGEKDDFWHSCIYLGCDSCLHEIGGYHKHKNTKPATKEQHNLLFQKMKEAGYEWDAKKKELKQIGVKTLDADNMIEWLENTIKETTENYGVYKEIRLTLPYNSVEDLINDFKEDFGLC